MELTRFLAISRGDEPADLLLQNAHVVNVFTGEIVETGVAVAGDTIVGVGDDYEAREAWDLGGRYVCPGLIDSHVHIESSMLTPPQFARAVVPRGTTTVVTDPHEIANVAGVSGIKYMLAASEGLPLTVLVNLPSCVPATELGTAGATLDADSLVPLANLPRVIGLAEFMNVPGAVLGLPGPLKKLVAFQGRIVDGHAPGLSGKWLQAYIGAGPGSDHESTTVEEMLEKLRLGMIVFVREATGARNLRTLVSAITQRNSHRCAFCTDDRHPADLLDEGHMDHLVRLAISEGLGPITALQMATINGAQWFRLRDRGAIAPGRRADMIVFSNLKHFVAEMVIAGGRLVARDGEPVGEWPAPAVDYSDVAASVHVAWDELDLTIDAPDGSGRSVRARVIGVVPDQIVTEHLVDELPVVEGQVVSDTDRDVVKLAVIERHRGSGRVGLGFVRGLGLSQGALASSVGHDAHNLTVAGCDDVSMLTAARAVGELGGGLAVASGAQVLASVPLPIGGLMSDQAIDVVRRQMDRAVKMSRGLGSSLRDPFMTLSFLALEVIPSLKLTDRGLVDVEHFDFVPLWVRS